MTRASMLCASWLLILGTVSAYVSATRECPSGYVDHGILQSPNHPSPYPYELDCYWHIRAPGKMYSINITMTHLDMEGPFPTCPLDILQIRQTSPTGPIISTYCGYGHPKSHYIFRPVKIASSDVYVTMKTDSGASGSGFVLHYEFIPSAALVINTTGSPNSTCHLAVIPAGLQTPHYPSLYPANVNCSWTIEGPKNRPIILEFETFRLPNDTECGKGRVEISDSYGTTISYCGEERPRFRTLTNNVRVTFISDSLIQGHGFRLNYRSMELGESVGRNHCGRTFDINNQFITTDQLRAPTECWDVVQAPEYHTIHLELTELNVTNEFYQFCINASSCFKNHSSHCSWSIGTPEGEVSQLNFEDVTSYFHDECPNGNLEIWDGYLSETPLLSYCGGPVPAKLRSSTNTLIIYNLGATERIDYKLRYNFVCESIHIAGQGFFVHRANDAHYFGDGDRTCRYTIRAAKDDIVRLQITSNTLSPQSVELYDGANITKNLTGVRSYHGFTSTNTAIITIAVTSGLENGGVFNMSYWSEHSKIKSGDRVMISHTDTCNYMFDGQMLTVIQKVSPGQGQTSKLAERGDVIVSGDVVLFGRNLEEWNISGDVKYAGQVTLASSSHPGRFMKALQSWVSRQNRTFTVKSTCDTAATVRVCPSHSNQ